MALVTLSEIISTIKGSIGSTTFSNSRAGIVAKRKSGTHKNYTAKQANVLKTNVYIIQQWQSLTLEQQLLWDDYATTYTQINKWGLETNLTGLQWFCHMNNLKYAHDNTILLEPPARASASAVPSYTAELSSFAMNLVFDEAINFENDIMYIFATLPNRLTSGSNRGKLRLIKKIDEPDFTELDILTDYETAFNVNWYKLSENGNFKIQFFIYTVNKNSWQNSVGVPVTAEFTYIPLDPDFIVYMNAVNMTNTTDIQLYNDYFVYLKNEGIWDEMTSLYLMYGDTASQHKFNALNAVDTDAAKRLLFNGGWSHENKLIIPNGTNAYAQTFVKPNTDMPSYIGGIGIALGANINEAAVEMGVDSSGGYTNIAARYSDTFYPLVNTSNVSTSYANTNSEGWFFAHRPNATTQQGWINGTKVVEDTNNADTLTSFEIYLGARNSSGVAALFSSKPIKWAATWKYLSDTQLANLYTASLALYS